MAYSELTTTSERPPVQASILPRSMGWPAVSRADSGKTSHSRSGLASADVGSRPIRSDQDACTRG